MKFEMEPPRRVPQCFAVFVILFVVSSGALTTFGKSPNQSPAPTVPPVKARECTSQSDCSSIQGTSCVRDGSERLMKCLCGNNKTPHNGYCSVKEGEKQLRHLCEDSNECDYDLICGYDNVTKSTGFNRSSSKSTPSLKICLCDEAVGYIEDIEDNNCNGSALMLAGILIPFISILSAIMSTKRLTVY